MKKKRSIFQRILLPLMIIIIAQSVLFAGLVLWGGTMDRLNNNAADILSERVLGRKNYLQNEMIQSWSHLSTFQAEMNILIQSQLKEMNMTSKELVANRQETSQILKQVLPNLIGMLRRTGVNDVFLILEGSPQSQQKSGLYLRDRDPLSTPVDNSDLLFERSPSHVSRDADIAMDSFWSPQFTVEENSLYYTNPIFATTQVDSQEVSDMGYWGTQKILENDHTDVITYSVPLVDDNEECYGVLGIALNQDYLKTLMTYDELNTDKSASYMLAINADSSQTGSYTKVLSSGPAFNKMFADKQNFIFHASTHNSLVWLTDKTGEEVIYGCIEPFQLYNSNTPFEQQQWVLIGLESKDSLFGFSQNIESKILIFMVISIIVGLTVTCLVGYRVSRPIISLAKKLKQSDPSKPIRLAPIHITEIDQLCDAIETLSHSVAENSSRLSQIINMVSMGIGAFELDKSKNQVFCTSNLFEVLRIDEMKEDKILPISEFLKTFTDLTWESLIKQTEQILRIQQDTTTSFWIRLKTVQQGNYVLGVVQDISNEMAERRRLEYERDYDLLTNLYNRRAFHKQANFLFAHPQKMKVSALLMMDLDNLKYINDTYGHDFGDDYIRTAASIIRKQCNEKELGARMSGDEFYVLFSGYDTKKQIRQKINHFRDDIANASLMLPDGSKIRLRGSIGVAWYPDDSQNFDELIKFADFAMYEVKNTEKGGVKDFDKISYKKDSFLLHGMEDLNLLIENQQVEYAFQPIVDVHTQTIFGYEALMRPTNATLRSVVDVLRIAKAQSKLAQIEHLTWFKALEAAKTYQDIIQNKKIFINSISSQHLSEAEVAQLVTLYKDLLAYAVIELTEGEQMDPISTQLKKDCCKELGLEIALDDFGTGYNGDTTLLELMPRYVKIDMSIVRDIDKDTNRREFYESLVTYFRSRNILILAEGVETQEEMETLVRCGTDLMQGYFFGKGKTVPELPSQESLTLLKNAVQDIRTK